MLINLGKNVIKIIYIYLLSFALVLITYLPNDIVFFSSSIEDSLYLTQSTLFWIYLIAITWFVHKSQLYNFERGVKDLKYSPYWVGIWWFIPFINLWMPYMVIKETYLSSYKSKKHKLNYEDKNIFYSWWGSLLLAYFLPVVGSTIGRINYGTFTPEYFELMIPFQIASYIMYAFSAFSFIGIIKQISSNEIKTLEENKT